MDRVGTLIAQLVGAIETTQIYIEGLDADSFLADRRTREAVSLNLIVIGEIAAQLVRDHPDFIAANTQIPWQAMRALRNRIAHGYHEIDFGVVWATVTRDLPGLLDDLRKLRP